MYWNFKKNIVKTNKKTTQNPLFPQVKMVSSASCERAFEEEKERLRTKKRASSSVDRPGGPYPRSLHGHYTDLKGRTWNPCKCDQSSWPWLGRPHMIKYNCKGPFPNASVVFWKSRKEGLKNNSQRRERKRSCVCVRACERKKKKKTVKQTRDKSVTDFFQTWAGFYMHTLSREALLADKVRWGSGADPSHSDDWWLRLNA